jgi:hypothetical protein
MGIAPPPYELLACSFGKERKKNKHFGSKCIQILPISKVLFKPLM